MDEEIRVVAVGKTGCGKSSTLNTLMGNRVFKTSSKSKSETKDLQLATRMIGNNQKLVCVDTPGIFDTAVNDNTKIGTILTEMVETIHHGPHIFILVLAIGRFTEEEYKAVELLKDWFGKHVLKHLIIVFTNKEKLDNDETTFEEYIRDADQRLKSIIGDCQGCMAINNFACQSEANGNVNSLVRMIKGVYIKNKKTYYTNGKGWSYVKSVAKVAIVAGAGIASVAAVPVVLGTVGFTSAGIAAGSYAASLMSAAAVANGGAIAAGSTVAVLQSVGAAGLSIGGQIAVGSTGAGLTAGVMKVLN